MELCSLLLLQIKELRDELDTLRVTHEKTNQTLADTQQRLDTTDAGKYYLQCMWQLLQAMIWPA